MIKTVRATVHLVKMNNVMNVLVRTVPVQIVTVK